MSHAMPPFFLPARNARQPLHEQLRRQMLQHIKDAGLREAMLSEYKEMASTISALLHLLAGEGVPDSLSAAAQAVYGECMARLTQSSIRCQSLALESSNVDAMLHLATADANGDRVQ
ncbi:hypothetical protein [Megalodesulfovibrio paquesii]